MPKTRKHNKKMKGGYNYCPLKYQRSNNPLFKDGLFADKDYYAHNKGFEYFINKYSSEIYEYISPVQANIDKTDKNNLIKKIIDFKRKLFLKVWRSKFSLIEKEALLEYFILPLYLVNTEEPYKEEIYNKPLDKWIQEILFVRAIIDSCFNNDDFELLFEKKEVGKRMDTSLISKSNYDPRNWYPKIMNSYRKSQTRTITHEGKTYISINIKELFINYDDALFVELLTLCDEIKYYECGFRDSIGGKKRRKNKTRKNKRPKTK